MTDKDVTSLAAGHRLPALAGRGGHDGRGRVFYACLAGVLLTPLVLPWRYIARHYFNKPGDRWRKVPAT